MVALLTENKNLSITVTTVYCLEENILTHCHNIAMLKYILLKKNQLHYSHIYISVTFTTFKLNKT